MPLPRIKAVCKWCGQPFVANSRTNVYCGSDCRMAAALSERRPGQHTGGLRCSVCQVCGKPFREPPSKNRHRCCPSCGGWRTGPPRAYVASPPPLWSSANPVHRFAERCAQGHRNGGRIPRVEDSILRPTMEAGEI